MKATYLEVVRADDRRDENGRMRRRLLCRCVCGKLVTRRKYDVVNKLTTSCGCKRVEIVRAACSKIDGLYVKFEREYKSWHAAKRRCVNPDDGDYKWYGGRGIKMCPRWSGAEGFKNFMDDMGPCPKGMTLDRDDNNGDYEPGNCKWSDQIDQHNNRTDNVFIEFDGKRLTVAQWERETGIKRHVLYGRVKYGWSAERTLTTPVRRPLSHDSQGG